MSLTTRKKAEKAMSSIPQLTVRRRWATAINTHCLAVPLPRL